MSGIREQDSTNMFWTDLPGAEAENVISAKKHQMTVGEYFVRHWYLAHDTSPDVIFPGYEKTEYGVRHCCGNCPAYPLDLLWLIKATNLLLTLCYHAFTVSPRGQIADKNKPFDISRCKTVALLSLLRHEHYAGITAFSQWATLRFRRPHATRLKRGLN